MLNEILVGDIDIIHAEEFKAKYLDSISKNKSGIVFDCSGVEFIDSTGLGAFVALSKEADKYGERIELSGLKRTIKKLFDITKLSEVIKIHE